MAGFLRRFFSPKQESEKAEPKASKPSRKGADKTFYLSPDDAKSYGNVDYMREARTVKRTFMGGKYEYVQEVSAESAQITKNTLSSAAESQTSSQSTEKTPTQTSSAASSAASAAASTERRRAGSEMDKFRNMAKDLGRK